MPPRIRLPLAAILSVALAASIALACESRGDGRTAFVDSMTTAFPVVEAQFAIKQRA